MHSVLITLTEDDSRLKIGKLADMCKENLPSLDSYLGEHHSWRFKGTKQSDTLGSVVLPAKPTQAFRLITCMFLTSTFCCNSLHSTCHCLFFREVTSLKRIKTSIDLEYSMNVCVDYPFYITTVTYLLLFPKILMNFQGITHGGCNLPTPDCPYPL